LVGDLRIDNRADLAAALEVKNLPSVPDSSFALTAYERWGERMLHHVIGEFALAIVDRAHGGVFLARDVVGTRPLCIHERRGVVAFASNAMALTEIEGVGHSLDVTHAAEAVAMGYSSERTFVEGVRWVPAGTALWVDASGVRRWRWWDADPEEIEDLGPSAAHEDALREAFDKAVAARLRSSGGIGATVSGGLDSTSVAATSARLLAPDPFRTYTSAPRPGWTPSWEGKTDPDESPLVRELADMHPNMVPAFVHVDGTGLLTTQEPLWEMGAGPARNPCNMLWVHAIRERAQADGVTTLMTGDFGNMFFSAEGPQWLVANLRAGRFGAALAEASALQHRSGAGWYALVRDHIAPYAMPRAFTLAKRLLRRPSPFEPWLRSAALRPEIAASLDLPRLFPYLDERRRREQRTIRVMVLEEGATQADNAAALAALTGVQSTDPTVDRRVMEVAMRQPEWIRRHDGIDRAVVRGAMAGRLPPAILHRTRRGAQLPEWLDLMTSVRADLGRELDALEQHATSRELMDVGRLRSLFDRWPDRSAGGDLEVYRAYRSAFLRALVLSRYLRWFETRAAESTRAMAGH
jgi:asparagine synthase (glutamine-hydrolysing)